MTLPWVADIAFGAFVAGTCFGILVGRLTK